MENEKLFAKALLFLLRETNQLWIDRYPESHYQDADYYDLESQLEAIVKKPDALHTQAD